MEVEEAEGVEELPSGMTWHGGPGTICRLLPKGDASRKVGKTRTRDHLVELSALTPQTGPQAAIRLRSAVAQAAIGALPNAGGSQSSCWGVGRAPGSCQAGLTSGSTLVAKASLAELPW